MLETIEADFPNRAKTESEREMLKSLASNKGTCIIDGKTHEPLLDKLDRMMIVDSGEVQYKGILNKPEDDMKVRQDWEAGMPKGSHYYRKRREIMAKLAEGGR